MFLNKKMIVFFYTFCSFMAKADTLIQFTGNLIVPDCTINNGNPIEVDFGEIEIQSLDALKTTYYATNFNVPIECPYTTGVPKLTLSSNNVFDADNGIIGTSKLDEGLVIYLKNKDGIKAIAINKDTDISDSVIGSGKERTLTLNAGLGRVNDMSKLTAGVFTATAGLQIKYD